LRLASLLIKKKQDSQKGSQPICFQNTNLNYMKISLMIYL